MMKYITLDNIRGLPNEDSIFYLFHTEDETIRQAKLNKANVVDEINESPLVNPKEHLDVIKAENQLRITTDKLDYLQGQKYHQKLKCDYYNEMLDRSIDRARFGVMKHDDMNNFHYGCTRCLHERYNTEHQPCKGCEYLICGNCIGRVISKDYGYCWFCQYEFRQGIKEKPKTLRVKGKRVK